MNCLNPSSVESDGLGVNPWIVESWIKRGLLKAGRMTGQNLFAVSRRNLRQFLLAYPSHWDHRLADRWLLLDILCGDEIVATSRKTASE